MAYEIHITGKEEVISIEEWKDAISAVEGVRLSKGETSITNPKTGEVLTIGGGSPLDVEILDVESNDWVKCLYWRAGRASINARFDLEDTNDPFRRALGALASHLSAEIVGDEGEKYVFSC